MKKIAVIVKDKTTLELMEDGKKGDIIDLEELMQVDSSLIERIIDSKKDPIYNERLKSVLEGFNHEKEKLELEHKVQLQERIEQEQEKQEKLKTRIAELEAVMDEKEKKMRLEIENEWQKRIAELEKKLATIQSQNETEKLKIKTDFNEEKRDLEEAHREEIRKLEETIQELRRQKASLSVKVIGEDLEAWCNNEVLSYMQTGFKNCLWEKDNNPTHDDGDAHGTKADFIFSIFSNESHDSNELLTRICLEMKDENPDSVNKQKNEKYYRKLDADRSKKNCEYAVLVSNLESDQQNALPIYRVPNYANMYVVRPAYLMVFLNLIVSLTTRFAYLITKEGEEKLIFKSKEEIMHSFEDIKKTYLEKPLETLQKQIEDIRKQSMDIIESAGKIDSAVSRITTSYLEVIQSKLERYEVKLKSNAKKIDSLS